MCDLCDSACDMRELRCCVACRSR
ncbi:hypothetical protein [Marivivens donghaensis]